MLAPPVKGAKAAPPAIPISGINLLKSIGPPT
jgi:hypothetical protein